MLRLPTRARRLAWVAGASSVALLDACSPRPTSAVAARPSASVAEGARASSPKPPKTTEWMQPAGDVQLAAHARGGRDGGPAVIVLHGGPGLSHEYTRPLDDLATDELRVIGFDQRGVGHSSPPPIAAYGLEHHVEDVEVLRLGQGVARIHLLGHAWGGLVAMAYAVKYPSHVASLVLVDSVAPTSALWRAAQQRFAARQKELAEGGIVPTPLPASNGPDCSSRMRALLPVYFADPRAPAAQDLGGSRCHTGIFEVTMFATGEWDLLTSLRALSLDALIVQGAADPFGPEPSEAIAAAMPRATKAILPACGQLPFRECAAPFFAAVRPFLVARLKS